MPDVFLVIPCFNEATRFKVSEAEQLLSHSDLHLVLVNDGSTDDTQLLLERFAQTHEGRASVVNLPKNQGKAEAVRLGLTRSLELGAEVTGYLDADFATPATEMLRLLEILQQRTDTQVLLGARWLHLGGDIDRSTFRHYGGRVFATLASQVLKLKVYDTQCGAKWFRVNAGLASALERAFVSPWAFDVELIGRLRQRLGQQHFLEVPLQRWVDVAGSKISFVDMINATLSLFVIHRALKRDRYSNSLGGHQGKNSGIS